jgi:methyl-accepting chemotaxis protein WspA
LNAAIEAEKAGEYGLGFAVVATEIRRLADQTAVATLDIEQMVKEMQSAVSSGVLSMEKFSDQVRRSVSDVNQVAGQLAGIIEEAQNFAPRFENVQQGMHFQSQGASQINKAMLQLSESAHQAVVSIRQSNSAIDALNDAAHTLQDGVSKFRVSKSIIS